MATKKSEQFGARARGYPGNGKNGPRTPCTPSPELTRNFAAMCAGCPPEMVEQLTRRLVDYALGHEVEDDNGGTVVATPNMQMKAMKLLFDHLLPSVNAMTATQEQVAEVTTRVDKLMAAMFDRYASAGHGVAAALKN